MYFIVRAKAGQPPDKVFGKVGPYSDFISAKSAMEIFQENDRHYFYFIVKGRIKGEAE